MTRQAAVEALRDRFNANCSWPVQWDNQPFDRQVVFQHEDHDHNWARFTVLFQEAEQTALGLRRHRYDGVAVAQLFVPMNTGDDTVLAEADTIISAFRAVSFSSVTCRTPWADTVGRTPDGEWWQVNVNIPFYSDETD